MTPVFEVLQPGVLATTQDLGRTGWQRDGVGTAGAMDRFALQVANLLVGNARGEAALEIGLGGLRLRCLEDWIIAVCGADLGAGIPLWKSVRVRRGDELHFKGAVRGAWAYLAPAGGLVADTILGSKSTCLRAKLGRALAKGDVLRAGPPGPSARDGRGLLPSEIPAYPDAVTLRAVLGPEEEMFRDEALEGFLSASFDVTPQSNRMGYRLAGRALSHRGAADILSDAVVTGSIQVPADGQPIVLMADRQTTGGYATIATVISADLPALAQARPGTKLSFRSVSVDEAQSLAIDLERTLSTIQSGCGVGRAD
jgi:antagonist of KipI